MHGAGLINHNFMRPNTSFIEILPCLFGGEWHDYSFQVPSKKQNIVFAWKIQAYNPVHCHPSRLESHTYRPGMLNAVHVAASPVYAVYAPLAQKAQDLCVRFCGD